jgi:hypothetical protein
MLISSIVYPMGIPSNDRSPGKINCTMFMGWACCAGLLLRSSIGSHLRVARLAEPVVYHIVACSMISGRQSCTMWTSPVPYIDHGLDQHEQPAYVLKQYIVSNGVFRSLEICWQTLRSVSVCLNNVLNRRITPGGNCTHTQVHSKHNLHYFPEP